MLAAPAAAPAPPGRTLVLLVFVLYLLPCHLAQDPTFDDQGVITRTCSPALLDNRDLSALKKPEAGCSVEIDVQVTRSTSGLTCAVADIQNNQKESIYNWQLSWDFEGNQKLKVTNPEGVVIVSSGAVDGAPIRLVNPTDQPNIQGSGGFTRFLLQFLGSNVTAQGAAPAIDSVFFNGQQCSNTATDGGRTCSMESTSTAFNWKPPTQLDKPVCRSHFCCRVPWIPVGDIITSHTLGPGPLQNTSSKASLPDRKRTAKATESALQLRNMSVPSNSSHSALKHKDNLKHATAENVTKAQGPAEELREGTQRIVLVPIDELMVPHGKEPNPEEEPSDERAFPGQNPRNVSRAVEKLPTQEKEKQITYPNKRGGNDSSNRQNEGNGPKQSPEVQAHPVVEKSAHSIIHSKNLIIIIVPIAATLAMLLVAVVLLLVRRRWKRRDAELYLIKSQNPIESPKYRDSPDSFCDPFKLQPERSLSGSLKNSMNFFLPEQEPSSPFACMSRSSSMPAGSPKGNAQISRMASVPVPEGVRLDVDDPLYVSSIQENGAYGQYLPMARVQSFEDRGSSRNGLVPKLNLPLHMTCQTRTVENRRDYQEWANIDFAKEVILEHKLGHGGFGQVFAARWKDQRVAVKMVPFLEGYSDAFPSQSLRGLQQEMSVMSQIKHEHIISFIGACLVPPNVCIVEELALGGSLHDRIYRKGPRWGKANKLTYNEILHIATDVASAMLYLHPGIVHRDLKPQNVLLDWNGRAKVCDFGIAKMKDRTFVSTKNVHAGTPSYMAPELFEGSPVSEKVDCFSFGVLLWECFASRQPWADHFNPMRIIFAVGVQGERLPVPEQCPCVMRDLMQNCWERQPELRPTFEEIAACLRSEMENNIAEEASAT